MMGDLCPTCFGVHLPVQHAAQLRLEALIQEAASSQLREVAQNYRNSAKSLQQRPPEPDPDLLMDWGGEIHRAEAEAKGKEEEALVFDLRAQHLKEQAEELEENFTPAQEAEETARLDAIIRTRPDRVSLFAAKREEMEMAASNYAYFQRGRFGPE